MTDMRPRNDDLLYGTSGEQPQVWRVAAIFGSIMVAVTLLVGSYLAGGYNPASTGFSTATQSPAKTLPAAPAEPAVSQLVKPTTRSGS